MFFRKYKSATDQRNPYHSYLDDLPDEAWKEKGWGVALETADDKGIPMGPYFEFTPEIWEQETRENVTELLEVERSVSALSTNCFHEVGNNAVTKAPYLSGDFRDHPEFERHLEVLEKAWGKLPEAHPRRKTLNLIKVLAAQKQFTQRLEKSKTCLMDSLFRRDKKKSKELLLRNTKEVFWRRINGINFFYAGFAHDDKYYAQHREWYKCIAPYANIIVIETPPITPPCQRLSSIWKAIGACQEGSGFAQFMCDSFKENPHVLFADLESRNNSKICLDTIQSFGSSGSRQFPDITPKYLEAYFGYLCEVSPHLAEMLKNEKGLEKAIRLLSTASNKRFLTFFEQNGTVYSPSVFITPEGKPSSAPTGAALSLLSFGDAMAALKIWRLTSLMQTTAQTEKEKNKVEFSRWEGPVFSLQGAMHLHQQRWFLDHLPAAMHTVINNPQFIRQADCLFADPPLLETNLVGKLGDILQEIQFLNSGTPVAKMAQSAKTALDRNQKTVCSLLLLREPLSSKLLKTPLTFKIREEFNLARQKKILPAFSAKEADIKRLLDVETWRKNSDNPHAIHFAQKDREGEFEVFSK